MTGFVLITREQWEKRYSKRIMDCAGWDQESADQAASAGAEQHSMNERAAGNSVAWYGGPRGLSLTPEEQADEEMSYWEDDGE